MTVRPQPRGAAAARLAIGIPPDGARDLLALLLAALSLAASLSLAVARPVSATAGPPTLDAAVAWLEDRTGAPVATEAGRPDAPRPEDLLRPRPRPGPFAMDLYRGGDFVHQQTKYWCVAASVQTMINIMEPGRPDQSRGYQRRLHFQGRGLDQDDDHFWRRLMGQERWRKGHHGLGLTDWAGLLDANGYGPYVVDRAETRKQAIRKAARAIRLTGKPAGLVVWRGAHAWVMSGFEATADPAYTNAFKVRKVVIQDPWYPSISSIWGASRPPGATVAVSALDEDYLPYDRPLRRHPKRDGRFMLILPTAPDEAA
jgi:hypothetical protein